MRMDFDTAFPQISGNTQQDLRGVLNYLFMLREQLDYLTGNLDTDNFGEAGLKNLEQVITRPLTVKLQGTDETLLQMKLWQEGLTLKVENGEVSSTVSLMAGESLISSQQIKLTGMVTFSDLADSGKTTINGDNITTGTLKSINTLALLDANGGVGGQMSLCYLDYDSIAGGIVLDDNGDGSSEDNKYRMFLYTNSVHGQAFAMKLQSAGSMSLFTGEAIYIRGNKGVRIAVDSEHVDGAAIRLYGDVYINDTLIS